MKSKNPIGLILFICIFFLIIITFISYLLEKLFHISIFEGFYAKRNERIRIYKSDEIFDPDESPDVEELDPDDNPLIFDPDQQPPIDNKIKL